MKVFVTFSPSDSKWSLSDFDKVVRDFVEYLDTERHQYRLVTSFGQNGDHHHFHCHILTCRHSRADSMRRHVMTQLPILQIENGNKKDIKYRDDFRFRFEAQRGRCRDVQSYLDKNASEGPSETYCPLLDSNLRFEGILDDESLVEYLSPKYCDMIDELKKQEVELTEHEMFQMLDRRVRSQPGSSVQWHIDQLIQEGWVIYRIRDDALERICRAVEYRHQGRHFGHT